MRPLVVDIYAVSDTQQRRHDDASHVGYSWSRDAPVTSLDDDDYDDEYDDYAADVGTAGRRRGHVTSYLGQPVSTGHESSLSQSGRREVEQTGNDNNNNAAAAVRVYWVNRRYTVTMATAAATVAVIMVTVR